jgi:hypothetical protein
VDPPDWPSRSAESVKQEPAGPEAGGLASVYSALS